MDLDGDTHFSGEHIVKVIYSKKFFLKMLEEAGMVLQLVLAIVKDPVGAPEELTKILKRSDIDSTEFSVICNYLAKVLLDGRLIFKALIIKYLRDLVSIENLQDRKKVCHNIYSIVLYISLYLIFNNKKDIKKILPILQTKDLHAALAENIKEYLNNKTPIELSIDDNKTSQKYMAKMLASIYDYFYFDGENVIIRDSKFSQLRSFLEDVDGYSIEHFLINDSNKFLISGNQNEHVYPSPIFKNYRKSIYNYIFIPKKINDDLANFDFYTKIEKIKKYKSQLKCKYTLKYIEIANKSFKNFPNLRKLKNEDEIMRVFSHDFILCFNQFRDSLLTNTIERLTSNDEDF